MADISTSNSTRQRQLTHRCRTNDAGHFPKLIIEMQCIELKLLLTINRRTIRHSGALAQRRVVISVAYVPRPDWREAEISMI